VPPATAAEWRIKMKDYQEQLNKYLDYPENRKQVEEYLEKFWLNKRELIDVWLKIKSRVFNTFFKTLPDPLYNKTFETIILKGGSVLPKDNFDAFLTCLRIVGDTSFIILEDYDDNNPPHKSGPPFRFKYPINITIETIMSGADISKQVFLRPVRNYFVFGDSGQWGKYVGNDFEYPLEIIGFHNKYSSLFRSKLIIPEVDTEDLKQWTAFYGMKLPRIN
jgi:hypothetical protein